MSRVTERAVITDRRWERLRRLLPVSRVGRPAVRCRRWLLEAVCWRIRVGAPWRDLPSEFGPWSTAYHLFRRWQRAGVWRRILTGLQAVAAVTARPIAWTVSVDSTVVRAHQHAAGARRDAYTRITGEPNDHGLGRSRGGWSTKIHLAADQDIRPLSVIITPGQAGDNPMMVPVLESIDVPRLGRGRSRRRPDQVLGDKAYSSRTNRTWLRRKGIRATIPVPADQQANRKRRGNRGGRPPAFDPDTYKIRNTIERAINRLKNYRAVACRYDKLAVTYQATIHIACILTWLD